MDSNRPQRDPKSKGLRDAIDDLESKLSQVFASLKENIFSIQNNINTELSQLKYDMTRGKGELKRDISNLNQQIISVNRKVLSLEEENRILKKRLDEVQKQIDILISDKIKQVTLEFREFNGGQIGTVQHQDLLSTFNDLKQTVNALSNEIKNRDSSVKSRGEVRSDISKIFTHHIIYEDWLGELFGSDKLDELVELDFKSFYNKVIELIKNMSDVKPEATFYIPRVGEFYNKEEHVLISEKCDSNKPISIIVFPGFCRGKLINERAVVYTDLLAN